MFAIDKLCVIFVLPLYIIGVTVPLSMIVSPFRSIDCITANLPIFFSSQIKSQIIFLKIGYINTKTFH